MNPYVETLGKPIRFIPVYRNGEREAIVEGEAMTRAFRNNKKGRQMVKTKTNRLTQREAA